ncbi:T9SS type A sorting domain-containing protein [Aquimarina sp. D1M17]|uniref:T9SS type A sorting domain-containing protein n=1 Tax=Aquimarina acroporae TaxID=2937283 RepID=UPI0020C0BA1A|nr:T9SS type A sorting domain-containing protein [Aquimarina acroporae]MCK8524396.1 T9SS type A sorting domain-containing protein [Aquimarina acroporae]
MKYSKLKKWLCGSLLVCVSSMFAQQNIVYHNNFDQLPVGQYNEEEIEAALGVNFCKGADEGRVFISEFQERGNVLKVKYPKGKVKTNDSGMHTKLFWNHYDTFEELYFSYRVYIPEDFEFRAGAKLPGLSYQTSDRNMSLRLMWRNDGLLEFYNHFETRPTWDGWTASVNWSLLDPYDEPGGPQPDQVKLKKGAWNHIEVYHKLNTPGQNNGIMRGWLNGELAIDITDNGDYRQSGQDDIRLNSIYLSTFFGGSSDAFKPTRDQYAYFDDFIVSKSRIGYNGPGPGDENEESLSVAFKTPSSDVTVEEGYDLEIEVDAVDNENDIREVNFYIDDNFVRRERFFPYTWGHDRSPNPEEVNGLTEGVYLLKAIAINTKGETKETSITLTVENNSACSFTLPAAGGIPGLDNVYYNNVHIIGDRAPGFLHNFVNFSVKWNPIYNELSKFAILTNDGFPNWYVDFSDTAQFQLKDTNPEITLRNTGVAGLDDSYWVTLDNGELILKSKDSSTLICFSNSEQPPSCMLGKSQKVVSINNAQRIRVYPNPAKETIFIEQVASSSSQINILDLNGEAIASFPVSSKQSEVKISLEKLPAGLYFIEVKSSSQKTYKTKFIKE